MSWASRRRAAYLGAVVLFFAALIAIPIVHYIASIKPTCFDGIQNQGETAVDEGGPCLKLNPADLAPVSVQWARSFRVRDGSYTAVAYLLNPNKDAGVAEANYQISLYDGQNVLVAQKKGTTFIMPGGTTPVLITGIDTGNRTVVHTFFEFSDQVLDWQRMSDPAAAIQVGNQVVATTDTAPRITAQVQNLSFSSMSNVQFVATVFDTVGNAIAASGTTLPSLGPSAPVQVTFTWPGSFGGAVGRVDVIPLVAPQPLQQPAQ